MFFLLNKQKNEQQQQNRILQHESSLLYIVNWNTQHIFSASKNINCMDMIRN